MKYNAKNNNVRKFANFFVYSSCEWSNLFIFHLLIRCEFWLLLWMFNIYTYRRKSSAYMIVAVGLGPAQFHRVCKNVQNIIFSSKNVQLCVSSNSIHAHVHMYTTQIWKFDTPHHVINMRTISIKLLDVNNTHTHTHENWCSRGATFGSHVTHTRGC